MSIWAVLFLAVVALLVLPRFIGFRAQKPADLAGQGPRFDLRAHLSGPILCEGVIYGPLGRVSSRFVAEMQGEWDGNRGVLRERFRYDSGRVQDREWRLTVGNDGTIRAEADDVVGAGTGRAEGPAVQLLYRIKLDAEAGGHVLDVVDWMYLMENGTVMNRSQFRKFGIKVAELVATMRPMPQALVKA
ncbi:DUF3833 domain-containing protein [Gemmobacter straminiformis]|uniref:DUF3833 domain-containing protein n=1 Tax=Paragemmobacter straminiformis TaxID=2045119 RepID=A0A842I993_9RHOB|nr:DUF3833 domain-containing protein [Gemmobacter straminiformis]MBC2836186.1 DUF3833 domain-containing protein [Gemmobacter straminiformis]